MPAGPEAKRDVGAMRAAATAEIDPLKPITLIGVAALGEPDLLIEVEATAVLS